MKIECSYSRRTFGENGGCNNKPEYIILQTYPSHACEEHAMWWYMNNGTNSVHVKFTDKGNHGEYQRVCDECTDGKCKDCQHAIDMICIYEGYPRIELANVND